MSWYAYKAFLSEVPPDDQARLESAFCKEADRDFDGDASQDGDYWVLAAMYVRELKEERDDLSRAFDSLNDVALDEKKRYETVIAEWRKSNGSHDSYYLRKLVEVLET